MSTLEIKGDLYYDMIAKIDNEELLMQLKEVIDQHAHQNDFRDELSVEQQAALEEALKESNKKENFMGMADRLGTYPYPIFQHNIINHEIKCRLLKVVAAGEQHSALGDTHMVANLHISQVINPDFLPYLTSEAPGIFDID